MRRSASVKVHLLCLKRYLLFYLATLVIFFPLLVVFKPPPYVYPLFTIMAIVPLSLYLSSDLIARLLPGTPRVIPVGPRFLNLSLFFLAISLYGSVPYLATRALPPADALFESIAATTTTSFTLLNTGSTPSHIFLWRSFQSWQGTLFYLFFISELLQYYWGPGGEGPRKEIPLKFPFMSYRGTAVSISLLFFASITVFLFFAYTPITGVRNAVSLSLAVSSTGGVSSYGNTLPPVSGVYFLTSIALILVSLNHLELLRVGFRRRTIQEPLESFYYLIFLGLLSLLVTVRYLLSGTGSAYGLFAILSSSSGAGIYPKGWPGGIDDFTLYVLLLLMVLGGCTFSVTSGFRIKRAVAILRAIHREIIRAIHPMAYFSIYEERESSERFFLHSALFIFFLYMSTILIGAVLLIISGIGIRDGLFLTVSALTNTGLDPSTAASGVNLFTPLQKLWLVMLMIIGRLDVIIPIFLFSPSLRRFTRG